MKSLQFSIAVALALPSAAALAVDPGVFEDTAPVILRIGGATASDNTLKNLFALDPTDVAVQDVAPCQDGTMDVYFSGTLASQADYIISCLSTDNVAGLAEGSHIVIIKETAGGSANGILQVARQITLPRFITPTEANLATPSRCVAVANGGGSGSIMTFGQWDCNAALSGFYTAATPHVGISDVDPTTFVGTAGVTADDAGDLLADPGLQVVFSPIVSIALRNRLQDLQYGAACDDAALERETLACIPSLSSTTLAGIFSNKIDDWNQVEIAGVRVGTAYGDQPARICRRQDTSGTQTSFKLHYLNEGCNTKAGPNAFVGADDSNCTTNSSCTWNDLTYGGHRVFAGGGSGDVRSCVNFNSTTQYRIGVASTEAFPEFGAGTTNRFRYIRVDGQEATLAATQEGRYNFFTENTLNTRDPDVTPAGSQPIWTFVKDNIGTAAAAAGSNFGFRNAACSTPNTGACDTGVLVAPEQFVTEPDYPLSPANLRLGVTSGPINTQARTLPGDLTNNCNTPFQVLPSPGG